MDWSNEVTLEFLRLYESEPVIWNPKEPLHKNRSAVADAWKRIEASLSVKCSVQELKKKKESLMATFRPLLNKVRASMKTRKGADEVYKPSWFAFESMAKFLYGIYQPRSTINTQGLEDVTGSDNRRQNEEVQAECPKPEGHTGSDDVTGPATGMLPNADSTVKVLAERGSSRKRTVLKIEAVEDRVGKACQILRNVCEKPERDECSLYAELLAKQLRALDENKREIVMHDINGLMFRAKMQNQNFRSLPSPYSSPVGGLHSTAASVGTGSYCPPSFGQDHSHIPVFISSSELSLEAKNLSFTANLP